mgnify:CR=1 FL=1
MRKLTRYCCVLAAIAVATSVVPATSVAMSQNAVMGQFGQARGSGPDVSAQANLLGGAPGDPAGGLGSFSFNASDLLDDVVGTISESEGVDPDLFDPPRPSPN